jgi:hypothetical protein
MNKDELKYKYGATQDYEIDGVNYQAVAFYDVYKLIQGMEEYIENGYKTCVDTIELSPRQLGGVFYLNFYKRIKEAEKPKVEPVKETKELVLPVELEAQDQEAQEMLEASRAAKDPSEKEALTIKRGRPAKK